MSGGRLEHAVHAKLRATGDYTIAAWSRGLTRDQAEAYAFQSAPGDVTLARDEIGFSSLSTGDGGRLVAATMLGSWSDNVGRPWLYHHVAVVPAEIFQRLDYDPFVLEQALARKEEFESQTGALPELTLPEITSQETTVRHERAVMAVHTDERLIAALTSILSGSSVYWICGADFVDLLRACVAILPKLARKEFTFVSQAAHRPRLEPIVLGAARPIAGLADSRPDPVKFGRGDARVPSMHRASPEASALYEWVSSGDPARIERWRHTADRFLSCLRPGASWPSITDALRRSIAWTQEMEALRQKGNSVRCGDVESALRRGSDKHLQPPDIAVTDLLTLVVPPTADAVEAAFELVAGQSDADAWKAIAREVGDAWGSAPQEAAAWIELLERAFRVVEGSPEVIVDAAVQAFAGSGAKDELLTLVNQMPDDRPWSRDWSKAIMRSWEEAPGGWPPQALLEAVIRPTENGLTLPSRRWLVRFGRCYGALEDLTAAASATQASALQDQPSRAITELARLAFDSSNGAACLIAEDLLLWALAAEDSPLPLFDVAQLARDFVSQHRVEVGGPHVTRRQLRGDLLQLLIADGCRLQYPRLATRSADQVARLGSILDALSNKRSSPQLRHARLMVAASVFTTQAPDPVAANRAAQLIERQICEAGHVAASLPDDVVTALVDACRYPGLSPRARGMVLWHLLSAASRMGLAAPLIAQRLQVFSHTQVVCDDWPQSIRGGEPLLSLECLEGLIAAATNAGEVDRWRGIVVAVAERLGSSRRAHSVGTAITMIANGFAQLWAVCRAQAERSPGNPLPLSDELRSGVERMLLPRRLATALKGALRDLPRSFRLFRSRGWR